jgi:membrane peptidoglycan carboxypeptidase
VTVREGLHRSVNLVFIRIMRDILRHVMYGMPESSARILEDVKDPLREDYLLRFADREGKQFLSRFYRKYKGMSPDSTLAELLRNVRPQKTRMAAIHRTVAPDADFESFVLFMRERLPDADFTDAELRSLFDKNSPDVMSLSDRGYLARIHPLELWLVGFLRQSPEASLVDVFENSARERHEVYSWLLKTRLKNAQDTRLRTMLEMEAFLEIHRAWERHGYPFGSLVPSLATALGSSGDRPAALAELVGIILNGGERKPTRRIQSLRFAEGTPFETAFEPALDPGEQVMRAEVAAVLATELVGVVEKGTASRLRGAFQREDGTVIPVGGKTGTGDNRFETYGPGGNLIESRAVNRVATFVFRIGDRFFGVVTAYVPGSGADTYAFTSVLATQVLKSLAPSLMPLVWAPAEEEPPPEPEP